jgi:protein-disulfide isomerase
MSVLAAGMEAPNFILHSADFSSGVRSGVNGTPTFFINGARFDGNWDEAGLIAALEK